MNEARDFPIHGFLQGDRTYTYLGRFKVLETLERQQNDADGKLRRVYIFKMRRVAALPMDPGLAAADHRPHPHQRHALRATAPAMDADWAACLSGGTFPVTSPWSSAEGISQPFEQRWQNSLAALKRLQPGDRLVITRGQSRVLAVGTVQPNDGVETLKVQWDTSLARRVPPQPRWLATPVEELTADELAMVLAPEGAGLPLRQDMSAAVTAFGQALRTSHVDFGSRHDQLVRAFLSALATKRFAILTGLSGAGKTQIALALGSWFGAKRYLSIPVRPDWAGPDALFGYPDALKPLKNGRPGWYVPDALAFMLSAYQDANHPYLLILDEMNLAHVERYFADFLSGIESGEPCLPNLVPEDQGHWRVPAAGPDKLPLPDNLFVVGTVNVDETTYMFSPKVLDRANTFEFRVSADDLRMGVRKPLPVQPGDPELVRGYLCVATEEDWQDRHPVPHLTVLVDHLKTLHRLLAWSSFEYGHRVLYEVLRFAAVLRTAGEDRMEVALDLQVMQKLLPRSAVHWPPEGGQS